MLNQWFSCAAGLAVALVLFGGALFAEYLRALPAIAVAAQPLVDDVYGVFESRDTQWLAGICLSVYWLIFVYQNTRRNPCAATIRSYTAYFLLLGFGLAAYVMNYGIASSSTDAMVLLAGVTFGQGVVLVQTAKEWNRCFAFLHSQLVPILTTLLLMGALLPPKSLQLHYHGHFRWSGIWKTPNTFGLLMALGTILAVGQFTIFLKLLRVPQSNASGTKQRSRCRSLFPLMFYAVAITGMGFGLIKSYSRGAWAGMCLGVVYLSCGTLLLSSGRDQDCSKRMCVQLVKTLLRGLRQRSFSSTIMTVSVLVLVFWNFQQTEQVIGRRTLSISNENDFSSRNRMLAYRGSLQMMSDKCWFGFGWNRATPAYEQLYQSKTLVEGTAIESNDYLFLATTLGIPALAFFIAYIWLHLSRATGIRDCDLLAISCRASVVVLLAGFWFDGGLFKLALAIPFWICLEVGSTGNLLVDKATRNRGL